MRMFTVVMVDEAANERFVINAFQPGNGGDFPFWFKVRDENDFGNWWFEEDDARLAMEGQKDIRFFDHPNGKCVMQLVKRVVTYHLVTEREVK